MAELAAPILHAKVTEDGRLTVEAPTLRAGERVDVILLRSDRPSDPSVSKPIDVLAPENFDAFLTSLTPSGRSAEEIQRYLREERDSWE